VQITPGAARGVAPGAARSSVITGVTVGAPAVVTPKTLMFGGGNSSLAGD
jgi:hypothetical protein